MYLFNQPSLGDFEDHVDHFLRGKRSMHSSRVKSKEKLDSSIKRRNRRKAAARLNKGNQFRR